jgi:hypothetical protein
VEQVRPVPGAVALLEVTAFLAPDELPRDLFAQQLDPPPDDLAVLAGDPFAFDDAVAALRRYALVKASTQTLTVHRLLQQVLRDHLGPPATAIRLTAAVRLLAKLFPRKGHRDPRVWPTCEQLLPHSITAVDHAEQLARERTNQAGHADRNDTLAEAAS